MKSKSIYDKATPKRTPPIVHISSYAFHQWKRVIFATFMSSVTYVLLTHHWNAIESIDLWDVTILTRVNSEVTEVILR